MFYQRIVFASLALSIVCLSCTKDKTPTPTPDPPIPEFTSIPDRAFENILITMGLDDVLDGKIKTVNAISYAGGLDLKNTNINNPGILDMTGIQAFRNIIWLNLTDNRNLREVDVSKNTKLVSLTTSNTDISSLDLSKCTELTDANLQNLETLPEYGVNHTKGLVSVDLSNCLRLQKLYLTGNRLRSINVKQFSNLTNLWLNYNLLEGDLDLSGMSKLDVIVLHNNNLSTLNIKGTFNNGVPRTCRTVNNPSLTQIRVTNLNAINSYVTYLNSIGNIWYEKDGHTSYVE